jgi:hypothetical protein
MMRIRPLHIFGLVPLFFLPLALMAQISPDEQVQASRLNYGMEQLRVVAGQVTSTDGSPVFHALIEIVNNAGQAPRILQTDSRGLFQTNYEFVPDTDEVRHFTATIKITRKGFQPARKFAEITSAKIEGMSITLRPLQPEDPNQLSLSELIRNVAPRLRRVEAADGLAAKDEKDYGRGVQDFLDRNHADRAVPYFYKVVKDSPSCLRCRTMLALAELSWGDWDDAHRELETSAGAYVANRKLGSFEPLFVRGVLSNWQGHSEGANAYITEALKFAPTDAFGLQEMGRVQCQDLEWFEASQSLKKAVAAGAGPDAHLMLAEALCWAGTPHDAEAALSAYLNGREIKDMPPRVRSIWANIQAKRKDDSAFVAAREKAKKRGQESVDYIRRPPTKDLQDFEPATDQSPLNAILETAGKSVAELFADLPNICSVENIRQERLNHKGSTASAQEYKYRYLLTTPANRWGPGIEEVRATSRGNETPQLGASTSYMLTSGFMSAPLVFHPDYQSGSAFRLLGRQKLMGRNTYVVAYAQDPAKARIYGAFQQGTNTSFTYSQGMAWIDAENYQIVRLVTDLLRPVPLVKLDRRTTQIDFREVYFKAQARTIWLPDTVMVTLNWNGANLRNKHAYSDFLISNVNSTQKIDKPKNAEVPPEEAKGPLPPAASLNGSSFSSAPHSPIP